MFGNFINCDDIKTGGNTANAKFKRDVIVGGNLNLGRELSSTTDGVTTYTNSGGSILVKINGVTYILSPQKVAYLTSITSDIQDQLDNIDLTIYAPLASPTFTGTPL